MPLLVQRAIAGATELDRGFLFTLWRLTVRPAVVVEEYLSGPRIRYTSPRRYLVVIAAATTVVWLLLDATAEFRAGMTVALGEDAPADAKGSLKSSYWVWAAIQFFGCRWAGGLVRAIAATVMNTIVYWVALLAAVIGYVMIT